MLCGREFRVFLLDAWEQNSRDRGQIQDNLSWRGMESEGEATGQESLGPVLGLRPKSPACFLPLRWKETFGSKELRVSEWASGVANNFENRGRFVLLGEVA